jgi:hypothetical protein
MFMILLTSPNRWICGSLSLTQIPSLRSGTSHTPQPLYAITKVQLELNLEGRADMKNQNIKTVK